MTPVKSGFFAQAGVLLAFLALTAAMRASFIDHVGVDEAFFAVVGRDWSLGALPYAERFDVKPPGMFLLYRLAAPLFGAGVVAIKGLEMLFVAAGAFGLWRIGRDFFSAPVGVAAGLLYPLYSLALCGVNAPVEVLKNTIEIFAVLAALGAARDRDGRRVAASGLLFGCAFTLKQSAAVDAAAVFAALMLEAPDAGVRIRWFGYFALAAAAAPLAFAGYFWAEGVFPVFWQSTVLAAGGRLGDDSVSFVGGLTRLPGGLKPMLAPVAAAALLMLRFGQWRATALAQPLRLCLGWLAGVLLSIVATRAMYEYYFLPLVAPLLLLAAVALFHLMDLGVAAGRKIAIALAFALAVASPVLFGFDILKDGGSEDRKGVVAAEKAAVAAGLAPGDTALVVSRGLQFYADTGARPVARVFLPQHLLCDFPTFLQGDVLAQAMAARPRFVLMADPGVGMVCEKPERLAAARQVLSRDYDRIAAVSGDWDHFELWRAK